MSALQAGKRNDAVRLCKAVLRARHVESAYTTMWRRYQSGAPPVAFAVESAAE
ncbi:MAG: hypothetical protein WAK04_13330 [Xanthobacteraceae bacterium]